MKISLVGSQTREVRVAARRIGPQKCDSVLPSENGWEWEEKVSRRFDFICEPPSFTKPVQNRLWKAAKAVAGRVIAWLLRALMPSREN